MGEQEISTGAIGIRFGFSMTMDFIANTLGVPASKKVKSACFWTESEFNEIAKRLVAHVQKVADEGYGEAPPKVERPKKEPKTVDQAAKQAAEATAAFVATEPVVGFGGGAVEQTIAPVAGFGGAAPAEEPAPAPAVGFFAPAPAPAEPPAPGLSWL